MVTFQNVTPVYLIYFIVNKNSSFPISGYKKPPIHSAVLLAALLGDILAS